MKNNRKNHTEPEAAPSSNLDAWYLQLEIVRSQNGEVCELGTKLEQLKLDSEKLQSDCRIALQEENEEALARLIAKAEILSVRQGSVHAQCLGHGHADPGGVSLRCRLIPSGYWRTAVAVARSMLACLQTGCLPQQSPNVRTFETTSRPRKSRQMSLHGPVA